MGLTKTLQSLLKEQNKHFISVDNKFFKRWKYIIILIMKMNPNYKHCVIYRKRYKRLNYFVVVGLKYSGENVKRRTSGFAKRYINRHRNYRCIYCDDKLNYDNATSDHIIPISSGGNNTKVNLIVCCRYCNNERGNTPFREYLRYKNKNYRSIKFI